MSYPYKGFQEWIMEEQKTGNIVATDQPIKCGDYNNIVDIGNGIPGKMPETELRAFVRYLHSLPENPIGLIKKPVNNRPDIPVVINAWSTRERVERTCGCKSRDELCQKLLDMKVKKIKPVKVSQNDAPCKEVIITEKDIDLTKDISRCWVEFNQMLWSTANSILVTYDPKTKSHGLHSLRAGQYEWRNANPKDLYPADKRKNHMFATLIYLGNSCSRSGGHYYKNYRINNKPMPAVLLCGSPTDINVLAGQKLSSVWPDNGDEYEVIGGFRGEPLEIVESETIPGLMVPAYTEWVIEGEFLPEDETMPPYAEDIGSGYMFGGESCPIFKVKCITHRKNPLWAALSWSDSGMHGHYGPHTGLFTTFELEAINFLRSSGLKVKNVAGILDGSVQVVQLDVDGNDKPPYYGKQVAMALRSSPGKHVGQWTKYIIVVGPDIDPYDFSDVMWALGTRSMPISDSIFIEKGVSQWGDPGAYPGVLGWKAYGEQVMIDALIKVPERYEKWPPRCSPVKWEKEAIKRMQQKLNVKK